jgi:hypothetical protein
MVRAVGLGCKLTTNFVRGLNIRIQMQHGPRDAVIIRALKTLAATHGGFAASTVRLCLAGKLQRVSCVAVQRASVEIEYFEAPYPRLQRTALCSDPIRWNEIFRSDLYNLQPERFARAHFGRRRMACLRSTREQRPKDSGPAK